MSLIAYCDEKGCSEMAVYELGTSGYHSCHPHLSSAIDRAIENRPDKTREQTTILVGRIVPAEQKRRVVSS